MSALQYRPEIDGLRAVAITAVILFHAGATIFPGGFLGVDVFFVISGYLITSILVKELKSDSYSIANFYKRRAKRILPALVFVCLCITPFVIFLLSPAAINSFFDSLIATSLFSSNIYFLSTDSYFATPMKENLLLHTWSLAVEEQYYFIFPIILTFLWRKNLKITVICLLILTISSLALSEVLDNRSFAFYSLPTRMWELLVGSLISFLPRELKNNNISLIINNVGSLLGAALIGCSFIYLDKSSKLPGFHSLLPVIGSSFVIVYGYKNTLIGRILSIKPVVFLGLISYSAYLWHQPIFSFSEAINLNEITAETKFLLAGLTFLLSVLTWRFIEKPARSFSLWNKKRILCLSIAIILFFTLAIIYGEKIQQRWPTKTPWIDFKTARYGGSGFKFSPSGEKYGNQSKKISFILYGDSHANQYLKALENWAHSNDKSFLAITHSACFSFPIYTNEYYSKRDSCINLIDNIEQTMSKNKNTPVIFAYRWSKKLAKRTPYEPLNVSIGNSAKIGEFNEQSLNTILNDISDWKKQWPLAEWLLIGNVPSSGLIKERGYIKCHRYIDSNCPEFFPKEEGELFEAINTFKKFTKRTPKISFFNPYDALCKGNTCQVVEEKSTLLYSDHAHLSIAGANKVMLLLEKKLSSIIE